MKQEQNYTQTNDLLLSAQEEFQKGNVSSSKEIYNRILKFEPYNFYANQNLATILKEEKQEELSLKHAKNAILGDTKSIPAEDIALLGVYFSENNEPQNSLKCFESAIKKEPENYAILCNAALTANKHDKYKISIDYYLKAIEIQKEPEILNQLSDLYYKISKIDKAYELSKESLNINPDFSNSILIMANLQITMGNLEEAETLLTKAIDLDENCVAAYLALVRIKKINEKLIKNLERIINTPNLDKELIVYGCFALGEFYQNNNDFEKSFKYYSVGNSIRSKEKDFKIEPIIQSTQRYANTFTKDFLNKKRKIGNPSKAPIFIVGMPRSGTTLTEQIISSHSKAIGIGEKNYIELIAKQIPSIKLANRIEELSFPECTKYLKQKDILNHANKYFKLIEDFDNTKKIVNKLPANFIHLGLISFLFPNASLIHCKRHPLDVCLSIFFQLFIDIDYSYKIEDIAKYYKFYNSVIKYWDEQLPGRIYHSYYEELIFNQEEKSREIISHCNLKWEEQCIDFHKNKRNVHTASKWQVRQKIYNSSMNKWKNYEKFILPLKEFLHEEIEEYETKIAKLIEQT